MLGRITRRVHDRSFYRLKGVSLPTVGLSPLRDDVVVRPRAVHQHHVRTAAHQAVESAKGLVIQKLDK